MSEGNNFGDWKWKDPKTETNLLCRQELVQMFCQKIMITRLSCFMFLVLTSVRLKFKYVSEKVCSGLCLHKNVKQ